MTRRSSFVGAYVVRKLSGECRWAVATQFEYHLGWKGSPWVITVPEHFPTDGASIPRFLWPIWPPFGGMYDQAAALHDLLYRTMAGHIARVLADAIFYEAMEVLMRERIEELRAALPASGAWAPPARVRSLSMWYWLSRRCIHGGVRLGGWWSYWRYRRAAQKAQRAA